MYQILITFVVCVMIIFGDYSAVKAQEGDIHDVRGPLAYPLDPILIGLFIIIGVALLSVIIWTIISRRKRNQELPVIEIKLPWVVAMEQLKQLMGKDYLDKDSFYLFYTELSSILRNYLEGNFLIRAQEMTTEEFLIYVKNNELLSSEQILIIEKFLLYADMVKFARFIPTRQDAEDGYNLAKEFIEQTKKV